MQLSLVVATLGLGLVASAHKAPRPYPHDPAPVQDDKPLPPPMHIYPIKNDTIAIWTTQTVTAYKTFCPSPTSWVRNKQTYTATKSEWVTVTDCPKACTISYKPGPTPTIIPILPPVPKQNTTVPAKPSTTPVKPSTTPIKPTAVPVKPSVFVPVKNGTTFIVKTTKACPKHSPCPIYTVPETKAPAYTPPPQGYNSTLPVVKPSAPIGTSQPLTTVTATDKAGKTIISISTVPCPTLTTTKAGSTIVYVPGVPATTIVTSNKAGDTITSIKKKTPGTIVSVKQDTTEVVYKPAETLVTSDKAGSIITSIAPASTSVFSKPATTDVVYKPATTEVMYKPATTEVISKPAQTIVTSDKAGSIFTSIAPASNLVVSKPATTEAVNKPAQTVVTTNKGGNTFTSVVPAPTMGTNNVTSSKPQPTAQLTAGAADLSAPIAALAAVAAGALYFL